MKQAKIYYDNEFAGVLQEDDSGFVFQYTEEYLKSSNAKPISLTLPLQENAYKSETLFPFFDGLIPEGCRLLLADRQ